MEADARPAPKRQRQRRRTHGQAGDSLGAATPSGSPPTCGSEAGRVPANVQSRSVSWSTSDSGPEHHHEGTAGSHRPMRKDGERSCPASPRSPSHPGRVHQKLHGGGAYQTPCATGASIASPTAIGLRLAISPYGVFAATSSGISLGTAGAAARRRKSGDGPHQSTSGASSRRKEGRLASTPLRAPRLVAQHRRASRWLGMRLLPRRLAGRKRHR